MCALNLNYSTTDSVMADHYDLTLCAPVICLDACLLSHAAGSRLPLDLCGYISSYISRAIVCPATTYTSPAVVEVLYLVN